MRNQVSYVRQHFVEFVIAVVPMITKMLNEEESIVPIQKLVLCLISILKRADLSMYGEDLDSMSTKKTASVSSDYKIKHPLTNKHGQKPSKQKTDENLVINSELDINNIIEGIKSIIYH